MYNKDIVFFHLNTFSEYTKGICNEKQQYSEYMLLLYYKNKVVPII